VCAGNKTISDCWKRYPLSKLNRFSTYFVISKHENDSGFDYAVDTDKVEKLRNNKGFFLIFTSDIDAAPFPTNRQKVVGKYVDGGITHVVLQKV